MAKKRKTTKQSNIPPITFEQGPLDLAATLHGIAGALRKLADLLTAIARQL